MKKRTQMRTMAIMAIILGQTWQILGQDDLYYTPPKNDEQNKSEQVSDQQVTQEKNSSDGISNYERYRAAKEGQSITNLDGSSNTNNEIVLGEMNDHTAPDTSIMLYDSSGNVITINNYYIDDDEDSYSSRLRRFDGYYAGCYSDPYDFYPSWRWGISYNWGYYNNWGWYAGYGCSYYPYYWGYYDPFYYSYYSPYYYNGYGGGSSYYSGNHGRNQYNSGRKRIDTENRYSASGSGRSWGPVSYGTASGGRTRNSVARSASGESYKASRQGSSYTTASSGRQRSTTSATTRPNYSKTSNSRTSNKYTPSYNVVGSNVRSSYNSPSGSYRQRSSNATLGDSYRVSQGQSTSRPSSTNSSTYYRGQTSSSPSTSSSSYSSGSSARGSSSSGSYSSGGGSRSSGGGGSSSGGSSGGGGRRR